MSKSERSDIETIEDAARTVVDCFEEALQRLGLPASNLSRWIVRGTVAEQLVDAKNSQEGLRAWTGLPPQITTPMERDSENHSPATVYGRCCSHCIGGDELQKQLAHITDVVDYLELRIFGARQ